MSAGERWPLVKELVKRAVEQADESREAWVDSQDVAEEIRRDAKIILKAHARAQAYLEGAALVQTGAADATQEPRDTVVASVAQAAQTIGAYRIVRPIAEGRRWTVFLAARADSAFDVGVALKLARGGTTDPQRLDRMRETRLLLATLDHPGIARLLDGGTTDDGVPYVVVEYVEGEPIDVWCRRQQLSLAGRLELVRQVCLAVQHAHWNLVVHGDIRASNVLVTAKGRPVLLDLGIATALGCHRLPAPSPLGELPLVTASPEQLGGASTTVGTDVWGLGSLLYTLLAGRPPFAYAASAAALTRAIRDEDPPPPSRITPALGISRDVDLIVRRALAKRPQDRYDSAAALAADIGRYLEGRPVEAAPDSPMYRARRFVWRHRSGTAVAALVALAVGAGMASTIWQAQQERTRMERRFEDVRQFATTLIADVDDAIAPLPGSESARAMLVDRALGYLDRLSQDAGDNVGLLRDIAGEYERLGATQGGRGDASLGDAPGARASLDKALALRQRVAAAPAAGADDLVALAAVHDMRARQATTRDEQLGLVAAGLRVLDGLGEDARGADGAVRARSALLWTGATARAEAKDYAGARPMFEDAIEGYGRLLAVAAASDQFAANRTLAIACRHYGALVWGQGDRDAAMALYRRALDLDETRLAAQPDHGASQLDLAASLTALARAELETGDAASAVRHSERALELRQHALAADPQNAKTTAALERAEQLLSRARQGLAQQGRENR